MMRSVCHRNQVWFVDCKDSYCSHAVIQNGRYCVPLLIIFGGHISSVNTMKLKNEFPLAGIEFRFSGLFESLKIGYIIKI
jgi:hypothetical protein